MAGDAMPMSHFFSMFFELRIRFLSVVTLTLVLGTAPGAADWPNWRGPNLDGVSPEGGLPESWSPSGENLAWRVPYGGRSAPVVFANRVYLQNAAGRSTNWAEAEDVQERVMAFDADTGKVLWEYKFSVGLTDVPPHRVGWSSPTVDPETGNVYAFGVAGRMLALSPDGKLVWERALVEEFGLVTTHGGRTVSPMIEGDMVIVSGLLAGWGPWARTSNRYFALDKRTGETIWISTPQTRHYDTNYAMPVAATVGDERLLIVGGTDGAIHAMRANTGERVWTWDISKRSINTPVLMAGSRAIITHSEENFGTNEMGMIAALDPSAKGEITPQHIVWRTLGWQGGFSAPVVLGDRIYQMDNGAVLGAFDLDTGQQLWTRNLGTIQKGSIAVGDGKLYVGTENGKFFILRPTPDGVEVLDEDLLGTEASPEAIVASPAIADGRVYVVSNTALYAIGPKSPAGGGVPAAPAEPVRELGAGPVATVQVRPAEALIRPGRTAEFTVHVFDAKGRPLPNPATVTWSAKGLQGEVNADGIFTAAPGTSGEAGQVTATVNAVSGTSEVRVVPPLPWSQDFESTSGEAPPPHWINATGKFLVQDLDGGRVLMRREDQTVSRRARLFMGSHALADYTLEVDVRSVERRRQMGDVGVFAQQYGLILFGNGQRLELHPWQPATAMTVSVPFTWKPDTWYRMKLRVHNQDDGTARVQGKVWPKGEAEPAAWTIEKVDPIPHRQGSPGLYADAPWGAYYDNIAVTANGT